MPMLFAFETLAPEIIGAEAFGAEQTWFLINGSSCGIVAAILAT
jgi:arginine/lysine/ornithine decarboxylase